eukprot:366232-Chlamydomonas_euryale.AAC.25
MRSAARCGSSSAIATSSAGTSAARPGLSACSSSADTAACSDNRLASGDGCASQYQQAARAWGWVWVESLL